MNNKSEVASIVLATIIFLVANTVAQPPPQGPYGPDYPNDQGPYYPGPDYPPGPDNPNYQPTLNPGPEPVLTPGPTPGPVTAEGDHPSMGPASSEPISAPSASTTEALNYGEGQTLTQQDVASTGGISSGGISSGGATAFYMAVAGMQLYARYNGRWTTDPASVYYWRSTSTLTDNDQYQKIWSWEMYPNAPQPVWRNWGYRMEGYIHGKFIGDARGWHQLAMWGSKSGWSNVIWIYVW